MPNRRYTIKNIISKSTTFLSLQKKICLTRSSSLGRCSTYILSTTTSTSVIEWLREDLTVVQHQSLYDSGPTEPKANSINLNNYFHGAEAAYINENLTKYRRKQFAKVRKFRKINNWHSAWTIDGKIFVRKSQNDQVYRVYKVEDLDNIR